MYLRGRLWIVPNKMTFLQILGIVLTVLVGPARAQDTLTLGDGVVAKSFPIVAA